VTNNDSLKGGQANEELELIKNDSKSGEKIAGPEKKGV
jgi:hypothetical protein